jgi:hypothetical protein
MISLIMLAAPSTIPVIRIVCILLSIINFIKFFFFSFEFIFKTFFQHSTIQHFQLEEANAALRYFRADNEDSNINKPPRRAHLDLVKEAKLVTLAELYKDGVITYNVFVDKVIDFYDFNRAKLVRMSEDGEESDDISSSESDTEDN